MNRLTALILATIALAAAPIDQGQAQEQSAKPTYCAGPGAYRLPLTRGVLDGGEAAPR